MEKVLEQVLNRKKRAAVEEWACNPNRKKNAERSVKAFEAGVKAAMKYMH